MVLHILTMLVQSLNKGIVSSALAVIGASLIDPTLFATQSTFPLIGDVNAGFVLFVTLMIANASEDFVFSFIGDPIAQQVGMFARPAVSGITAALVTGLLSGATMQQALTTGALAMASSIVTAQFIDRIVVPLDTKIVNNEKNL